MTARVGAAAGLARARGLVEKFLKSGSAMRLDGDAAGRDVKLDAGRAGGLGGHCG